MLTYPGMIVIARPVLSVITVCRLTNGHKCCHQHEQDQLESLLSIHDLGFHFHPGCLRICLEIMVNHFTSHIYNHANMNRPKVRLFAFESKINLQITGPTAQAYYGLRSSWSKNLGVISTYALHDKVDFLFTSNIQWLSTKYQCENYYPSYFKHWVQTRGQGDVDILSKFMSLLIFNNNKTFWHHKVCKQKISLCFCFSQTLPEIMTWFHGKKCVSYPVIAMQIMNHDEQILEQQ